MANIREAAKGIPVNGEYPKSPRPLAIALDTKGPEIRTGLIKYVSNTFPFHITIFVLCNMVLIGWGDKLMLCVVPQGVNEEIDLKAGNMITITINDDYKEKVDEEFIWVDYKNIVQVVDPGKKIYIDDGLISLIVREKGNAGDPHVMASV